MGIHQEVALEGAFPSITVPRYKTTLKFSLKLPRFDPQHSAYFWTLTIHRRKDIPRDQLANGVIIARSDFHAAPISEEAQRDSVQQSQGQPPSRSIITTAIDNLIMERLEAIDGRRLNLAHIVGKASIATGAFPETIHAVTLSLSYWPSRDSEPAFTKVIVTERI